MHQQKWEYQLLLVYNFVAVSLPGIAPKYNKWNRIYGTQGFSWRPGAVSFATIDTDDASSFSVELQNVYVPPASAMRILKVPFQVEKDGIILSDPLSQEWQVPIPVGNYALFFSIEPFEASWKYSLTFVGKQGLPAAEVILADELLSPSDELLMDAEPA